MNLTLHLILCGVLLLFTVAVALYKKWLEDHCDHYIHLHNDNHDSAVISTQESLCHRMDTVSKLQTYMIVAVVAYGLIIVAGAAYSAWGNAGAPV